MILNKEGNGFNPYFNGYSTLTHETDTTQYIDHTFQSLF